MSTLTKVATSARSVLSWRGFLGKTTVYCSSSVVARAFTGPRISQTLMRKWCQSVVDEVGIDIEVEGLDKIGAEPAIIVANHCSLLDIPVIGSNLDIDYRWVAKKPLFRVPLIGWHLWACGHIPVDRGKGGNFGRMQQKIDAVIEQGASVLFFAEGTRSPDGAMKPFRSGAFITAVQSDIPVLPIVIDGTEKLLVKGSIEFPRGTAKRVRMRVLDPVDLPLEGESRERADRLRDQVRARMVEALDQMRGGPGRAEQPTL